jgi:cell division protein FtsA
MITEQNETSMHQNLSDSNDENRNPIIVGLDIGTTKIVAIAGRKNAFGKLEILGFGRANSNGVQHGMVVNIEQTMKAIQQALQNCHKSNPRLKIEDVYVGIAGHHIKSLQTRGDIVRQDNEDEITQKEIDQLIADQYKTYIPAGDEIIDIIPQEFTVDSFPNIIDPIGYNGRKVGANFHIITGDRNAIRHINRSVEKSNLKIKDLVLQPLASAAAVMGDEDFEAGVAIVDIGGGTTDLAIFYEGVLKSTAVIPFGGENITKDIKMGLGVLKTQAEQMKVQFGSALADEAKSNAYITIPGIRGMAKKDISVKTLAKIIQARMSEIMDFVSFNIKQAGLDSRMLNGGVVLTGGGSQLKHVIQLTEYVTGMNARIGYPNEHLATGHFEELKKPQYATCIGLILKGYNVHENTQNALLPQKEKEPLIKKIPDEVIEEILNEKIAEDEKAKNIAPVKRPKKLEDFLKTFRNGIIKIFEPETDTKMN